MKIKRLLLEGFRGAPVALQISLAEKSVCVLAENGRGKTTIVDALEFWSAGDLAHYHREGYEIDAVVNVDSPGAAVTVETTAPPVLQRVIKGGRPGRLKPVGPAAVGHSPPPPLPVLRHRTMARFMDMTPGEKRKELLELIGFAGLTAFRQAIRTACTLAGEDVERAKRAETKERGALHLLLHGSSLLGEAERLRVEAGLTKPLTSEADVLELEVEGASAPVPDRVALVAELAGASASVESDESVTNWRDLVADQRLVDAHLLGDLIGASSQVLERWTTEACPLCEQPLVLEDLRTRLLRRSSDLAELNLRYEAARDALNDYAARLVALAVAAERVAGHPPPGGWTQELKLADLATWCRDRAAEMRAAVKDRNSIAAKSRPGLELDGLRREAEAHAGADSTVRALAALVRLRDQAVRFGAAGTEAGKAKHVRGSVAKLLAAADRELERVTQDALQRLGTVAADYYGRLTANPIYTDVRLVHRADRAGGVEFELVFDGRHQIAPPQRVLSESQLNSLGLALFLARLKVEAKTWRTVVLDDVVNSFDANHRFGLARLLQEEFSDWQVITFTHDRVFAGIIQRTMKGWRHLEVAQWTPAGGPVLVEGSAGEQLEKGLTAGKAPSELAGLARVALEQGLSRPLEKLGFEIRYDPFGRYTAGDYLVALQSGLKARGSSLPCATVLARIEASAYVVNLGAHDRPASPALTSDDLRALGRDLADLGKSLTCSACGEPVWWAAVDGGRRHQCKCAALAV